MIEKLAELKNIFCSSFASDLTQCDLEIMAVKYWKGEREEVCG